MSKLKKQNPILRLYFNLSKERNLIIFAFCSSRILLIIELQKAKNIRFLSFDKFKYNLTIGF